MRPSRLFLSLMTVGLAACAARQPVTQPAASPVSGSEPLYSVQLVETAPVETVLNHPDIPDAKDVWPALIAGATKSLDFAEFYASNAPGSSLERVVQAVEAAAARGVRVRFLAEEKFYKTYPETLDRLASRPGIQVRRYPGGKLSAGGDGILHAKYFLVDGGREAYLGSQNFDWRSLEHIQELGVALRQPDIARALADVFETDWALAGGSEPGFRVKSGEYHFPVTVEQGGEALRLTPVFSPKGRLPDESLWALPRLVREIDAAKRTVRVQVLTYRADHKGERFGDLEDALKRAAARGVQVKLLVSHWATREKSLAALKALAATPGIQIHVETIPRWSRGEIPFARVIHAKYMAVDGERAWVGTSNWEKDYFFESRNVGLIIEGARFTERLERFFDDGWGGPYTVPVEQVTPAPPNKPQ